MNTRARLLEVMNTPPFLYQVRGVREIEGHKGRLLLGDDMGLGKTYQAIAYLRLHPEIRPALIICPGGLKYQWQRELANHAGLNGIVLDGRTPSNCPDRGIVIINYDILPFWAERLAQKLAPQLVIIDECQKIKNRLSARSKATCYLARPAPHVLGLSGTPIMSRPIEFFPILNLIAPALFPSYIRYAFAYCKPKRGFRSAKLQYNGAENLEELREKVAPVMIRRLKSEVLPDLPVKTRAVIPVDIANRREYQTAQSDFIGWLKSHHGQDAADRAKRAELIVRLGHLKRLAAAGKIPIMVQWVRDFLEDTDQKIVLFAEHYRMIDAFKAEFPSALVVTGRTSALAKQAAVDAFQTDPRRRIFLANLEAGGVGTTLTAASTVAFLELDYVPGAHDQAEDRVLRIGQKSDRMTAYYFVARETVEERNMELLARKRSIIGKVYGTEAKSIVTLICEGLIGEPNHVHQARPTLDLGSAA